MIDFRSFKNKELFFFMMVKLLQPVNNSLSHLLNIQQENLGVKTTI